MRYHRIPDETVQRLPFYLRGVLQLSEQGVESISSRHFAEHIGVHPWQIRKDLSYFGDFGKPGVGYNLSDLIKHIKRILKLHVKHLVALVGVGNLGSALLAYSGFATYGLNIAAAFDSDSTKIGTAQGGVEIEDTSNIHELASRGIDLGIIAVPGEAAQGVADALVSAGVRGIMNFSPRRLVTPPKVKLIAIDIAMDLVRLPYYMPISKVIE